MCGEEVRQGKRGEHCCFRWLRSVCIGRALVVSIVKVPPASFSLELDNSSSDGSAKTHRLDEETPRIGERRSGAKLAPCWKAPTATSAQVLNMPRASACGLTRTIRQLDRNNLSRSKKCAPHSYQNAANPRKTILFSRSRTVRSGNPISPHSLLPNRRVRRWLSRTVMIRPWATTARWPSARRHRSEIHDTMR